MPPITFFPLQQRHGKHSVDTGEQFTGFGYRGILLHVGDMDRATLERAAAEERFSDADTSPAQKLNALFGHTEGRLRNEHVFGCVEFVDHAFVRPRERHGTTDDGGQHCSQVE